jgi:hypothetical protein
LFFRFNVQYLDRLIELDNYTWFWRINLVFVWLAMSDYKESNGAPGRIRTCDHWLRSPLLYPAELQGQNVSSGPAYCDRFERN